MTLIIPPGFGNAAFIFTGPNGTQPFVTTLGLDLSQYGGDFVNAANQAKAIYSTILGPITDNSLTLDRVNLAVGSDGPGGSVDSNTPPEQMDAALAPNPIAMSCIARKVTNELGRRGRGRMFLPAVLEDGDVNDAGIISTGRQTSVQTALTTFFEALSDGDMAGPPLPPMLLHSQAPTEPTPITGLTVQPVVGWIRGRIR